MSELGKSARQGLSETDKKKFDAMSTEQLEEIMRKDAEMPDSQSDIDAMLYITEVVARRQEEEGNAPDVQAAWESFNKYYFNVSDNTPISSSPSAEPGSQPGDPGEDSGARTSAGPRSRGLMPKMLRVAAGVALVTVLFALANSVIADAFRFDIWNSVVHWTRETFGFSQSDSDSGENQLAILREYLNEYGAADNVVPNYIPEGYEVSGVTLGEMSPQISVCCILENGKNMIAIQYHIHQDEQNITAYEKNSGEPGPYIKGGVEHRIALNVDRYTAAWVKGNTECSIIGLSSRKELEKMIDSIYGG